MKIINDDDDDHNGDLLRPDCFSGGLSTGYNSIQLQINRKSPYFLVSILSIIFALCPLYLNTRNGFICGELIFSALVTVNL